MKQFKINIMVIALFFISLLSSVALGYAMTPSVLTVTKIPELNVTDEIPNNAITMHQINSTFLPKVVK